MSHNQYQIKIAPNQYQTSQNPPNCSNVSTWGILTFSLYKNGSKDTTDSWSDLQIEVGDEVTWVWDPGSYSSGFPPETSLAWLVLTQPNGAKICEDPSCTTWFHPKSLASYITVETGTLEQQKSLPWPSACSGYSGDRTYVKPGTGKDSNTIAIQGSGEIASGNYLKLTYTIWFKTNNGGTYNYWYYDPEVDVKPAGSGC